MKAPKVSKRERLVGAARFIAFRVGTLFFLTSCTMWLCLHIKHFKNLSPNRKNADRFFFNLHTDNACYVSAGLHQLHQVPEVKNIEGMLPKFIPTQFSLGVKWLVIGFLNSKAQIAYKRHNEQAFLAVLLNTA